jgi:hypothetical protein
MALGYAPAVHRRAAKAAKREFHVHAKKARSAASRGSCALATTELMHAAAWHGVAVAERLDSGPKKGRSWGPTTKVLTAARKAVTKACACKRRK